MTTGTTTKVRLVRCPKCRHVLQEMPNIPVYQCGGCFTILQAKSQRQTISSLPETRAEETCNLDHVSEENASSSLSHDTTLQCAEECHSDHNNEMGQTESGDVNYIDNLRGKNTASENESNMSDQNCSENGGEKLEYNLSNNIQESGSYNNEARVSDDEQVVCANLSNEDNHRDSHQHDSLMSSEDCSSKGRAFHAKGELLRPMSVRTRFRVKDNGESSLKVNTEAETDLNREIGSVQISNEGEIVDTTEFCSIIATRSLARESLSSDIGVSSPDELLEQPQETAIHGLDRLRSEYTFYAFPNEQPSQLQERTLRGLGRFRSTDTFYVSSNEQMEHPPEISRYGFHHGKTTDAFDPTSFVSPSSDLSSVIIDLSKSPMTRNSRAYYDDSVSSFEETDDQALNRHKHGSNHAHRVSNHASSDIRPSRRDRVPVRSNYGTQQHFRNSAEILAERAHNLVKYSNTLEREKYMLHNSFSKRESMATANRIPNELYYTANFTSPDRVTHVDQEKLELLRMVSELQDQLKASMNDKTTGRVNLKDHHIPMYYDHDVEPEESFYNFGDPRYSGSNRPQQMKYSQIPFLAEAAISRHRGAQEQKWSSQLPPGLGFNKGLGKAPSRPNLYNSYGSCPSSPQQHVDPQFHMYSGRAKSDDQMLSDDGIRKNFREKPQLPKRHLRPLAGGAPFIICSYCLKKLQLPADFLLFKKRCHRLKCSACSEVLKFRLVNNTSLIPYMRECDDYSNTSHRRRNFTSISHVTDWPSVSCSDDSGQSFCKSCSQGNAVDKKLSNGLLDHEKERKISYRKETRSKGKTPVDYESAIPSTSSSKSKIIPSEIEELSEEAERGGSCELHRLMGYSSARHIIYS